MKWRWIFLMCYLSSVLSFSKGYQTFEENGKVGMKDEAGNVVLPPSFEALGWSDGNFSVIGEVTGYRLKGFWGIINLKKVFVTPAEFESLVYSGGECIVARKKINAVFYKAGCLNLQGEIKVPFVYDGILVQGLRAMVFNLKGPRYYYGLIDLNNRVLIQMSYKNIYPLGTLRYAVENNEQKISLFDEDGKQVTDFSIDSVSSFYKSYAIVYQNHLQGLIGRDGLVKLETKFNSVKITEEGKVLAKLPNEWLFITDKNQRVKQIFADQLLAVSKKLFIIKKGNAFGVIDEELETKIPIKYESISESGDGTFLAKYNSKMGVLTSNGKTIVPFSFDSLIYEKNNYRAFIKGNGWQLLNPEGKILTDKFYGQLLAPNIFGFATNRKGYWGMVDSKGHEFIHCVFDSLALPIDGLIAVKFKNKYGIINGNEDWIVAPQDFPLQVVNENRYMLKQTENKFIKSLKGEVIYFTPYLLRFDKENFTEFLPDGIEKTISYYGQIIERSTAPEHTEEIFPEQEGLRGIKKDDRYGFVDQNGRLVVANRYDSIGEFHEGLAGVKLLGKWGFVNASDQVVVNPNYDRAVDFKDGLAVVSRNHKYGLIDKTGKIALPLRYDFIQRLSDHRFLLSLSGLQGIADSKGNVMIEPRFNSFNLLSSGLIIACQGTKCGVITDQGLSVIPIIYDRLLFSNSKNLFLAERKSEWKEMELQ